jgi:hypothetical protein
MRKCLPCLTMALLVLPGLLGGCSCEESEPEVKQKAAPPAAAQEPPAPQQAAADQEEDGEPERRPGESILHAPEDYLRVTLKARTKAQKLAALAPLQQEIEMFKSLEGRYPKSLDELATWRDMAIQDPPKGFKYEYDPSTGKLTLAEE